MEDWRWQVVYDDLFKRGPASAGKIWYRDVIADSATLTLRRPYDKINGIGGKKPEHLDRYDLLKKMRRPRPGRNSR